MGRTKRALYESCQLNGAATSRISAAELRRGHVKDQIKEVRPCENPISNCGRAQQSLVCGSRGDYMV